MKFLKKLSDLLLKMTMMFGMSSVFAALPKPPDGEMPKDGMDWLDLGNNYIMKIVSLSSIAVGIIAMLVAVTIFVKAFAKATEINDMGHFFKIFVVGFLLLATVESMCYYIFTLAVVTK